MPVILRNRTQGNLSFEIEHYRSTATLTLAPGGSLAPMPVILRRAPPHHEFDIGRACSLDDEGAWTVAQHSPQVRALEERGMLMVIRRGLRAAEPVAEPEVEPVAVAEPKPVKLTAKPPKAKVKPDKPPKAPVVDTIEEADEPTPELVEVEQPEPEVVQPPDETGTEPPAADLAPPEVVDPVAVEEAAKIKKKEARGYPGGEPSASWSGVELKAYAAAHNVKVPGKGSKRVLLKRIKAAA